MTAVNSVITSLFNLALGPLTKHPWIGLTLVSALTGVVLLAIYRYTSNQRGIKQVKNHILAHLLEVVLYRDQMRVVVRAQARLVVDNLRYLGHALVPLAFMIVPVGLMLVQLDLRYGHRPLRVGDSAIIAVKLDPGSNLDVIILTTPEGVEIETDSLRMPALNEVDWRVKAMTVGKHQLRISSGGEEVTKEIVVGEGAERVSVARVGPGIWQQFLHPGERPIPAGGPVKAISVSYAGAMLDLLGRPVHWVWVWLIISMAFGYALKGPLRVQV